MRIPKSQRLLPAGAAITDANVSLPLLCQRVAAAGNVEVGNLEMQSSDT